MHVDQAIRNFLAPLLPAWELQLGEWRELEGTPRRYGVLKPAGGIADSLVRRPGFTLSLIGLDGGDLSEVKAAAYTVLEATRTTTPAGLAYLQASEPSFMAAANRRPIYELALSAITN